ncbi:MAG TPA: KAP family P-loop domain-containing protein [Cyanobacteria bacterium UBA11149]|nr:KAP family P-loop domain-containing protein [Cyanobacteria bacterium UBA11367]HBE57464.1 KAP family P-loop domain-containing protein [Cyanobacteria bacterium UBA11366]HBK64530.1 KAP family P-loop domain-containing protein [Cyanobacteria bacterium UBA11166]HBR74186.1 KAP family P-loop domain-containing protein [Cyanobacteria bacterium UBA11159]HBW88399.1 KAP family P-loop domain-containing protein [Cyanobacteria bacterium UBA11149]
MKLHLPTFFKACNPAKTLVMGNPDDRQYYINFSGVRGGKIVEELGRTISLLSPEDPTCQLFTGHIGCGKSTELFRLKAQLEQQDFHVVYFESSQDLDMADVDISDILLSIARSVSENLESIGISLKPKYFAKLFSDIKDFLQTPVELSVEGELSVGIARITARTKDSPQTREKLRQHLEPRTQGILDAINTEIIEPAIEKLKARGKNGLVVIIDNLDRVDPRPVHAGRSQPEYLFIDRGSQLRRLKCHVVYTIPLALMFSNEYETLKNRLGGGVAPKILPMVPILSRDGREFPQGMALLRQLVLTRAFPQVEPQSRLELIEEVFDSIETLNRLCRVSGGHIRNLLGLLYNCLQQEDPPFSRSCLESVIKGYRDDLALAVEDDEWDLLSQVVQQQCVKGEKEYQTLLRSMFVYEYRDDLGRWFGINPALAETPRFQGAIPGNVKI